MDNKPKQNLYRKYRPSKFSQLSGQEHISLTLQSAIASGRLSHAYMFSGPRGTGKTSAARLLAKVLNCLDPQTNKGLVDCCSLCDNCQRIENMNYMDIIEIDAASNNSVEDIRQMREKLKYQPIEGKYKIFIIDEVHMLSGSAFNAFLKTLEEPPENVVFILATTDPQKVPATIISRCQCFDFHSVAKATIQKRLTEVVETEKNEGGFPDFEPEALAMIADCAQGGFRDALSILDQISASSINETVTLEKVLLMTRRLGYPTLKKISHSLFEGNLSQLVMLINDLYSTGYEPLTISRDLLEYLRNCMLLKIDQQTNKIIQLPENQVKEMLMQIQTVSLSTLIGSVSKIEASHSSLRTSPFPKIHFESELIKIASNKNYFSNQDLEKKIIELEQNIAKLRRTSLAVSLAPIGQPREVRVSEAEMEDSNLVDDPLIKFRNAVKSRSNICQALLITANIKKPKNNVLTIEIPQAFAADKLKEEKNQEILLESAQEAFGEVSSVNIVSPNMNTDAPKVNIIDHHKEIIKIDKEVLDKISNKPEIADALEIFGGKIINISK